MGNSPQDALDWVDALVDLARSAREDNLDTVLQTVCQTVRRITDFQSVVFNLYRPAWDDFEVVIVVGSDEAKKVLMGSFITRATCEDELFRPEFEEAPGVFLVPGQADAWQRVGPYYTPERSDGDAGTWASEDALLVRLHDSAGRTLGFLSVDEPATGRRPDQPTYHLLRAVCSHAEQVLELTQASAAAAVTAVKGEALIEAADRFARCAGEMEVLQTLVDLTPALGFDRAAAYILNGDQLRLACSAGFPRDVLLAATVPMVRVETLLSTVDDRAGTYLVPRFALHGDSQGGDVSARNGRGPAAWHDHAVVVPARGSTGKLQALLAVEDPADRLLPGPSDLRILGNLVDRAASALDVVVTRAQLAHLATHDALTGLRNRRALDDRAGLPEGPSGVLLCDLDHFKWINDTYGHRLGDEVLARFADVLRSTTRLGDVVVRIGGEEFVVLVAGVGRRRALSVAQRIVATTPRSFTDLIDTPLTVSIGVTLLGDDDLYTAIDRADAALYEAKAAGRNRVVFGPQPEYDLSRQVQPERTP